MMATQQIFFLFLGLVVLLGRCFKLTSDSWKSSIFSSFHPLSSPFSSSPSIQQVQYFQYPHPAIHSPVSKRRSKSLLLQMGLFDGLKKFVNNNSNQPSQGNRDKILQQYSSKVNAINALEREYEQLSDEQLKAKTKEFRKNLITGSSLDSILVEAFAVVREAAWRVLELRHFDVQLIGGMALHDGRLAEMATGEGKTLVAVLPAYLNALSGKSSFVVTTNDYLARRDGETMGQIYRFLGLSVGIVQNHQKTEQRRHAYQSDIVYLANQELGFDFLRDNLAMTTDEIVQTKPYNFCIVDEADSILIDEARTPLIISRKVPGPTSKYELCAKVCQSLIKGRDYTLDMKEQRVALTEGGFKNAENLIGKPLNDINDPWVLYIINAIRAKELYNKDREYIIRDGTVAIVDSFTGRILEGRRFSDGMQQAIEAKEGLVISGQAQVIAKVTYQNLFRLFPKLAGMTGTASTDARELRDVYQLDVLTIPTALPVARRDYPDAVFRTKTGKMKALLKNILSNHKKGRPILIGTTSVEYSEELAEALGDIGIKANLLNAKPENIEKESEIVAQAGRYGAITVATNMAGRGTDILLGGSSKGLAKSIAKFLFFYKLNLLSKNEIIVKGKADEYDEEDEDEELEDEEDEEEVEGENIEGEDQEQPALSVRSYSEELVEGNEEDNVGSEGADVFLESSDPEVAALPSILDVVKSVNLWIPTKPQRRTELDLQEAIIACSKRFTENVNRIDVEELISAAADSSQLVNSAEIKQLRRAINTLIQELDAVVKLERDKVKSVGGLYVIGTSRHESRRVDNQLRGRSGRQGDPGTTRFFLSLEDDLFKIFGADKLGGILQNFRVDEDMPIESDLVVQALDKVQTQVEEYNGAIREQIYRLDEIASSQRSVVYSQRRAFLTSTDDGMIETFKSFCSQTIEDVYYANLLSSDAKAARNKPGGPVNYDKLHAKVLQFFPNVQLTVNELRQVPNPEVLNFLKEKLTLAMLEKQKEIDQFSSWTFVSFFRYMSLIQIDESWAKHLTRLSYLQEEIVAESILAAERNVLDSYREKAVKVFSTLMDEVRRNTIYSVFIYHPKNQNSAQTKQ